MLEPQATPAARGVSPAAAGAHHGRMARHPAPAVLLLLLLAPALLLVAASSRAAGNLTVYHCTDAQGRLSVRDTPCPKGQQQDTRSMLRPQDPPPRPARAAPEPTTPVPAAMPPRVVVVQAPRPLYECITPDGERYTSETGDGRPRYVPLWTLGYPGYPLGARPRQEASARLDIDTGRARLSAGSRTVHPGPFLPAYAGMTHVRDACHALPQAEVCARLVDRRDAIRTRFFNAQQRERDTLRVEERGVNARLANDCGIG
jgi:hypothetical protein